MFCWSILIFCESRKGKTENATGDQADPNPFDRTTQRGALGAHGLGVGLELAQDGGQLRHVVVGEADAEGAPVEEQTFEGLQHRRVLLRAVVLDDEEVSGY